MNRLALVVATTLSLTMNLWAQEPQLPPTCLWIEHGRVQFQGDLKPPPEMLQAEHVALLRPLGKGLILWTVQQRDDTGNLIDFSLSIANVIVGKNRQFLQGLDPFGIGTEWYLQRAAFTPSGRAALLRARLAGTGGFVNVYKLMLEPPYHWYAMPEGTPVWDSQSADGSVQARPYWELTPDWQAVATEREARYATIIVVGKSNPRGRKLWQVKSFRQIPDWAQPDIRETAVSPDGRSVAYTGPHGLWLAPVQAGQPRLLLPEGEGPIYMYETPVWHPDGTGLYFTRYEYSNNDVRDWGLYYLSVDHPGTATRVRRYGRNLCIPRT